MSAPGSANRPARSDIAAVIADRLASLGLAILVVERGGNVVEADSLAEEITGRSFDELRAMGDVSALLAPEERFKRTIYRERRRRGVNTDEVFHSVVVQPDGTRRPIEAAIIPVGDGEHTLIVARDLSDVVSLDQVIDWYAALVERMPIGVVVMDAATTDDPLDIRIWAVNPAAGEAIGVDPREKAGRTLRKAERSAAWIDPERALAMRGSGGIEYLSEVVSGDPADPQGVYRRALVGLPAGGVALLLDDITRERIDDLRQRRLAERLVTLGDSERRSIAMGIHDDPIQQIAAASLLIGQVRRRGEAPHREAWLAEADEAMHRAMSSLRDLVFELAPPELVESGFASAVSTAVAHLFGDSGTSVEIDVALDVEPPLALQTTAYRIVAEALTNARRHADARSIVVAARTTGGRLVIEVRDDGHGMRSGAAPGHLGVRSMRDRATAVGGKIEIDSSPTGTSVVASLPLDAEPDAATAPTVPMWLERADTVAESLTLERDSARAAEERAIADVRVAHSRFDAIGRLREILDACPNDLVTRAEAAVRFVADAVSDGCVVRIVSDDGSVLRRIASHHPDPEQLAYLDEWMFADRVILHSHPGLIAATGRPLLLDRSRDDWWLPGYGPRPPAAPVEPHHALGVPLRTGSRVFGMMSVVRDVTPEPLVPDDIPWMWALGDVVGVALGDAATR